MNELWDDICAAWDDELISTEEIKRLAALLWPPTTAELIIEEIEVVDLCGV